MTSLNQVTWIFTYFLQSFQKTLEPLETSSITVAPNEFDSTKGSELVLLLHVPRIESVHGELTVTLLYKCVHANQIFFKIDAKGVTPIPVPTRTATGFKGKFACQLSMSDDDLSSEWNYPQT